MSGLVKSVKKVFKKAVKFVKKIWKPVLAAVAIYFTAGVALSYFGSTAAFASSLPGFGAGGIFSKAAVWMGFNGAAGSGLYETALAKGVVESAAAGAVGGVSSGVSTTTVSGGAGGVLDEVAVTAAKKAGGTFTTDQFLQAGGTIASKASTYGGAAGSALAQQGTQSATESALVKALETQTKLSMVKMGIDTVSGLLAPDPYEEARKMHALQNASSFGVDREGNDAFGWGKSNSAQLWANMNKRQQGIGHNVGYGQSSGQSQFREAQFVPTQHEESNQFASMGNGGGQPSFIPSDMNRRG